MPVAEYKYAGIDSKTQYEHVNGQISGSIALKHLIDIKPSGTLQTARHDFQFTIGFRNGKRYISELKEVNSNKVSAKSCLCKKGISYAAWSLKDNFGTEN